MDTVFLPVYKTGVGYSITYGRRWSILEHLILYDLANERRTISDLAEKCNMPDRLVIEAVINLLRAAWIEVRDSDQGPVFTATAAGKKRAEEKNLPVDLKKKIRGISLCVDRFNNEWFRSDDLNLVNRRDLPEDALVLESEDFIPDLQDPTIRNLLYLGADESLEPIPLNFRSFANSYARIEVAFGTVQNGLPDSASMRLRSSIIENARSTSTDVSSEAKSEAAYLTESECDHITDDDIIVGGQNHFDLILQSLEATRSHIIIHSCFISPNTLSRLLPHFEAAARRKVKVDLMWGLLVDPEDPKSRQRIAESASVLDRLDPRLRRRVQLAPQSTGSHAKVLAYDQKFSDDWRCIVSSCNFLSSDFTWIEASVILKNQASVKSIVSNLVSWLLPASDLWSPFARRVHKSWQSISAGGLPASYSPTHRTKIVRDRDHYAAVTMARDLSEHDIVVGCDLYGLSAEISVLTPMEEAAKHNKSVFLFYSRASRFLVEEGRNPNVVEIAARGMKIMQVANLHAKFILFDDDGLIISSYNWMATVGKDVRARGAEIGVCLRGPNLRRIFLKKLSEAAPEMSSSIVRRDRAVA